MPRIRTRMTYLVSLSAQARRLENEHAHIVKVMQCAKQEEDYTLSMELGTSDLRDILDARPR